MIGRYALSVFEKSKDSYDCLIGKLFLDFGNSFERGKSFFMLWLSASYGNGGLFVGSYYFDVIP